MKNGESKGVTVGHRLTPLGTARLGTAAVERRDAASEAARSEIPTRIRIAPWGVVESSAGRFVVDAEAARLAVEAFEQHKTDLPVDYEHQTLGGGYSSPTGQAPAAGWIKRLEAEPGEGLFAVVDWTAPAMAQLAAKQYRYLSPVALVRRSDGRLVGLHSAALTNKPAIAGMEPIVNRSNEAGRASLEALRSRLALEASCPAEAVLVAASERLEALEREARVRAAERSVEEAMRTGRVAEAQRGFAIELALRDGALFEEWLRTAPQVVPLGRTQGPEAVDARVSRHGTAAVARAEYGAHRWLAGLTSEEAYVADALRAVERQGVEWR